VTSFYVDHGNHDEVTRILGSAVSAMGTALDHLNGFLRNLNQAVQGQAAPLWEEQQRKWTADYGQMQANLHSGTRAAGNIGMHFVEGDRNSARAMM